MSLSSWSQTSAAMFPSPSKRLVRSKSGLKVVAQHARGVSPWNLEEPPWVKDEEVTNCLECKVKFDFIKRRHHCRRCGKIFCGKCCNEKIQFHRMGFVDPVRCCCKCGEVTKKEKSFFDEQLKVLFKGAPFHVKTSNSISQDSFLYNCKLTTDERFVLLDNHGDEGEDISPMELTKILTFEVDTDHSDGLPTKFSLTLKETATDESGYSFEAPSEPSRKPSVDWIVAFQQGMKMVFESRSINQINEDDEAPSN